MNTNNKLVPQILHLDETVSTNAYIRSYDDNGELPECSVVWADFQTAGRGQMGNSWEGEKGQNLLFSMVIRPDFVEAKEQFLISQIASLSVKKTLEQHTSGISVKWPNDIYWHDKKICGMLIENDLSGTNISRSIIGIGLNINQQRFVSDAPNPISLSQITGERFEIDKVLISFMTNFHTYYNRLIEGDWADIREEYFKSLYRGEGLYPFESEGIEFEARISAIEPSGHIVLALKNGEKKKFAFKEVSFVIK